MKRFAMSLMLAASLLTAPMLTGCDSKVEEKKTVETTTEKKPDTTVVTDKEKTTKNPDGSEKTVTEHSVDKK